MAVIFAGIVGIASVSNEENKEVKNMTPKYIRNSGTHWTPNQISQLRKLANQDTPTRVIGLKLGRPVSAVYSKASEEGISLKPTNQSPYGSKN